MQRAAGTQPPETIIEYEELTYLSEKEVNGVHYKELEGKWTQIKRYRQVTKEDENKSCSIDIKKYRSKIYSMFIAVYFWKNRGLQHNVAYPLGTNQYHQTSNRTSIGTAQTHALCPHWTEIRAREYEKSGVSSWWKWKQTNHGLIVFISNNLSISELWRSIPFWLQLERIGMPRLCWSQRKIAHIDFVWRIDSSMSRQNETSTMTKNEGVYQYH